MQRVTVLAVCGATALTLGFGMGWLLSARQPSAPAQTKFDERHLVTGSVAAAPTAAPQPQVALPPAFPPPPAAATPEVRLASAALPPRSAAPPPVAAKSIAKSKCADANALGIARTVAIDTAGGPGFGSEQYKAYDFLEPGEVVLTFDDGPWPGNTPAVLAALAAQCTKATFFPIGQHTSWHPEILKQVIAGDHTIGSHTWSHTNLAKKSFADAKDEIEKGISAIAVSAGRPLAPFFRFPGLSQTPELTAYLAQRNIGIFSADLDSFDFKLKNPEKVLTSVISKLERRGKGIILMHDFQHPTAVALPTLLQQLKAKGFKVVHMRAKDTVTTLPEYDAAMAKAQAGQTVDARSTSAVVRTIKDGQ